MEKNILEDMANFQDKKIGEIKAIAEEKKKTKAPKSSKVSASDETKSSFSKKND